MPHADERDERLDSSLTSVLQHLVPTDSVKQRVLVPTPSRIPTRFGLADTYGHCSG